MTRQSNRHAGIDVRQLWVMISCFSGICNTYDEIDGVPEAVEYELFRNRIPVTTPTIKVVDSGL